MDTLGGYDGFGPNAGIHIDKDEVIPYAMEQCGIEPRKDKPLDPEFTEMLEEWFYSDNWA